MFILSATDARRKAHGLLERAYELKERECLCGPYGPQSHYVGYLNDRIAALEHVLRGLDSSTPGDVDAARWHATIMGDVG